MDRALLSATAWLGLFLTTAIRLNAFMAEGPVSVSVNPSAGTYQESVVDLNVMILGGRLDIERHYNGTSWSFGWVSQPVRATVKSVLYDALSASGNVSVEVEADGVIYQGQGYANSGGVVTSGVFFSSGGERLERNAQGWDWKLGDGRRIGLDAAGRLRTHQNAKGNTIRFEYDASSNHIVAVRDHWSNQVIWIQYASNGLPAKISDAATNGHSVSYVYDPSGRLTNVTDVLGANTAFSYGDHDRLVLIHRADGREIHLAYRVDGTLASMLDASGRGDVFDYNYDASRGEYYMSRRRADGSVYEQWMDQSFKITKRAVNGVVVLDDSSGEEPVRNAPVLTFSENGLPSSIQYADGTLAYFEYAGLPARLVREWTSGGLTNTYQYDSHGNLTNAIQMITAAQVRRVAMSYDALGNLLESRSVGDDSVAPVTVQLAYDTRGNAVGYTVNGQSTAAFEFDGMGRITQYDDGTGRERELSYDGAGRLTGYRSSDGTLTTVAYGENSAVISNSVSGLMEITYTSQGLPQSVNEGGELIAAYGYDELNRLISAQSGSNGEMVTYTYDDLDRLLTVRSDREGALTLVYDDQRPELAIPLGVEMPTYSVLGQRDEQGRMTQVDLFYGSNRETTARFEYDSLGRVVKEVNSLGLETRYTYDGDGNLLAWSNAVQGQVRQEWNVQGQIKSYQDGSGRTVDYDYDAWGRVTNVTENGRTTMRMRHDLAGRLIWSETAGGLVTEYAYDSSGRLIQEVSTLPAEARARSATRQARRSSTTTYNYVDQRPSIVSNDTSVVSTKEYKNSYPQWQKTVVKSSGVTNVVGYSYKDELMSTMTVNGSTALDVKRDSHGRAVEISSGPVKVSFPDQYFDLWNRAQVVDLGGELFVERVWDLKGNLVTQRIVTATGELLIQESATYNAAQQLTSVTGLSSRVLQYNGLGLLTGAVSSAAGSIQISRNADGAEVSPEIHYNLQTQNLEQYGDISYEWDENGNLTKRTDGTVVREYERDARGLIVGVKDEAGATVAEYEYNGYNQCISKTVNGVTTYYVYNGTQLIEEQNASGQMTRRYVYEPGSSGTPIAFYEGDKWYYCLPDIQGRVVQIRDQQGNVVWRAQYGAKNEPLIEELGISFDLHQSGLRFDKELGVYTQLDGSGTLDPVSGIYLDRLNHETLFGLNPYLSGYITGRQGHQLGKEYSENLLSEFCKKGLEKPLRGISGLVSLVPALLTGDLGATKIKPIDLPENVCSYVYAVNGIRSDSAAAAQLAKEAERVISAFNPGEGICVVNSLTNLNDTALFGVADVAQCALGHLGAKQLSDTKLAEMLKANINQCRRLGRTPYSCCIYVYAHSQGTQIAGSALEALDPEDRAYIRYIGIEGQSVLTRRSAGMVVNFINPKDAVPQIKDVVPGIHMLRALCGQNRDIDLVLTHSQAGPVEQHLTTLYTGAIVEELLEQERFKCKCKL